MRGEIYVGPEEDYQRGSETLSFAYSLDEGTSWTKHPGNPILPGPPEGLSLTGWRDPYVHFSESLDRATGATSPRLYAIIAGGVRDVGAALFLYAINPQRPLDWQYLGMPISPSAAADYPVTRWSGLSGFNWEVANFLALPGQEASPAQSREYIVVGAQVRSKAVAGLPVQVGQLFRPDCPGLPIWLSGDWEKGSDGTATFEKTSMGMLDYGWCYAANSFVDGKTGRRILWGE